MTTIPSKSIKLRQRKKKNTHTKTNQMEIQLPIRTHCMHASKQNKTKKYSNCCSKRQLMSQLFEFLFNRRLRIIFYIPWIFDSIFFDSIYFFQLFFFHYLAVFADHIEQLMLISFEWIERKINWISVVILNWSTFFAFIHYFETYYLWIELHQYTIPWIDFYFFFQFKFLASFLPLSFSPLLSLSPSLFLTLPL